MIPRVRTGLESRWEAAREPEEGCVWTAGTRTGHVEPNSIDGQHSKVLRDSKVRPFVLYSVPHAFLTWPGESGCDARTLARIAGHSSVAISNCYVHPSEDRVLETISRLARRNSGRSGMQQPPASDGKLLTSTVN
jgi:hypothetical protein